MSKALRPPRVRLHPYVEQALAKRLSAHCAAKGIPSSSVVEAALRQYLDRTSDGTLILRLLNRLSRAEARTQRDLELLSEAFGVWVRVWFAHTPSVEEAAKDLARRTAESRFAQFVEHVVERFSGEKRFLDVLPREVLADEVELEKITSEAPVVGAAANPTEGSRGG
jgi:CRP-like cAMP-binding protein